MLARASARKARTARSATRWEYAGAAVVLAGRQRSAAAKAPIAAAGGSRVAWKPTSSDTLCIRDALSLGLQDRVSFLSFSRQCQTNRSMPPNCPWGEVPPKSSSLRFSGRDGRDGGLVKELACHRAPRYPGAFCERVWTRATAVRRDVKRRAATPGLSKQQGQQAQEVCPNHARHRPRCRLGAPRRGETRLPAVQLRRCEPDRNRISVVRLAGRVGRCWVLRTSAGGPHHDVRYVRPRRPARRPMRSHVPVLYTGGNSYARIAAMRTLFSLWWAAIERLL